MIRKIYNIINNGSTAEEDYVIQQEQEVKAGTKGAMQSMFLFLAEKRRQYGIRCSMENFGEFQNVKIYPLYAVGNIEILIREAKIISLQN